MLKQSVLASLFSFSVELLRHNKLVSSAMWWMLQNFIAWLRSFVYDENRMDPKTGPWRTLRFIAAVNMIEIGIHTFHL